MKKQEKRSGVVRCQRCLKYGHYTYQCENEVAYRYRPSRTVLYKEKIKLMLNNDKGPKTIIRDRDVKRIYVEDKPSSDSQVQQQQKQVKVHQQHQQHQQTQNKQQPQKQKKNQQINHPSKKKELSSSSQSEQSSDSSSSSSEEVEAQPKKVIKKN